mgnify:CR=1 FL=1
MLQIIKMGNSKLTRTPLAMSIWMTEKESPSSEVEREQMKGIPYPSTIGGLMYAMVATRLDLAYIVGVVSWYMVNPKKRHLEVVKHIWRYLCGPPEMSLTYGPKKSRIPEEYTIFDYTRNSDNRKSTLGYVFMHAGGVISWRSKLQECTIFSTTKAEYIAESKTLKEAIWLQQQASKFKNSGLKSESTPILLRVPQWEKSSQSATTNEEQKLWKAEPESRLSNDTEGDSMHWIHLWSAWEVYFTRETSEFITYHV